MCKPNKMCRESRWKVKELDALGRAEKEMKEARNAVLQYSKQKD